jgi:hypothetical protein
LATGGLRWTLALDMKPRRFIFIALLAALLSGCASWPKPCANDQIVRLI